MTRAYTLLSIRDWGKFESGIVGISLLSAIMTFKTVSVSLPSTPAFASVCLLFVFDRNGQKKMNLRHEGSNRTESNFIKIPIKPVPLCALKARHKAGKQSHLR